MSQENDTSDHPACGMSSSAALGPRPAGVPDVQRTEPSGAGEPINSFASCKVASQRASIVLAVSTNMVAGSGKLAAEQAGNHDLAALGEVRRSEKARISRATKSTGRATPPPVGFDSASPRLAVGRLERCRPQPGARPRACQASMSATIGGCGTALLQSRVPSCRRREANQQRGGPRAVRLQSLERRKRR